MLYSITKIIKQYPTRGSSPVLVLANDTNNYVCKYQQNPAVEYSGLLVNEFVAYRLLKYWQIECPEMQIVKVKSEHVNTEDFELQKNWFKIPCFGSQHSNHYREVDGFLSEGNRAVNKGMRTDDLFLKIALFDIWICNEDRNQNNYNLLLDTIKDNKLIPIDHAFIFNTNTIDHDPYTISWEESLISSPLLLAIYTPKRLLDKKALENIKNYYYFCVQNCRENLTTILYDLPTEWCNDKDELYTKIEKKLFQDSWINETWQTFLQHLQFSIKKIK